MSEYTKINTPVGTLNWVFITGRGKHNYNEDGNEYTATIVLSKKKSESLLEAIEAEYKQKKKPGKKLRSLGYKQCDKDGNPDDKGDFYSFLFKTNVFYQDGRKKDIPVYNKNAKRVDIGDIKIGNGTKGCVGGILWYFVNGREDGISLYLNSVQIVSLIEYNEDSGFEVVEQGDFEAVKDGYSGFIGKTEDTEDTEEVKPSKL